jgi:hypothetical protein
MKASLSESGLPAFLDMDMWSVQFPKFCGATYLCLLQGARDFMGPKPWVEGFGTGKGSQHHYDRHILSFLLAISFCLFLFLFLFETGSHYVAQVGLKFEIFLLQLPKCWDYSCAPRRLVLQQYLKSSTPVTPLLLSSDLDQYLLKVVT